jgi:hypothetical protein
MRTGNETTPDPEDGLDDCGKIDIGFVGQSNGHDVGSFVVWVRLRQEGHALKGESLSRSFRDHSEWQVAVLCPMTERDDIRADNVVVCDA